MPRRPGALLPAVLLDLGVVGPAAAAPAWTRRAAGQGGSISAALLLQRNPGWSPPTVAGRVVSLATTGRVTSPGTGSPNRLLYSRPA